MKNELIDFFEEIYHVITFVVFIIYFFLFTVISFDANFSSNTEKLKEI